MGVKMSVFKLSKNREELEANIKKYIAISEDGCELYRRFKMDFKDADYEAGWIEYTHTVNEFEKNRYGNMHGGAIAAILDTSMGLTAFELGTGNASPTMDINISYVKGVKVGEELTIRAEVISSGKHSAVLRSVMTGSGEIKAIATATNRIYSSTVPTSMPFVGK